MQTLRVTNLVHVLLWIVMEMVVGVVGVVVSMVPVSKVPFRVLHDRACRGISRQESNAIVVVVAAFFFVFLVKMFLSLCIILCIASSIKSKSVFDGGSVRTKVRDGV